MYLRFVVLMVVKMLIVVFWDVMLCGLAGTNVLEEHIISIFRVKW
jgi:hypothetical protein